MTNPSFALDSASVVLPDGRTLFTDLTTTFDRRPTGMVGRNGVGKSVLARMLAGQVAPTSGRVVSTGSVHYLAQQVVPTPGATVSTLAGVHAVVDALERIEAGSSDAADFEALGDRWDIRQRLAQAWASHGLADLSPNHPAAALSGGEAMRVALAGAWLAQPDLLILDEPTNHLDRSQRRALIDRLAYWPNGLLVVSHDRELLEGMQRIVELSPSGLRDYAGGYTFYATCREREREQARHALEQRKLDRARGEQALREQRERFDRQASRGAREGRDANQAAILLGRQKEQSEASAGKRHREHVEQRRQWNDGVREAAQKVEDIAALALFAPTPSTASQRKVVTLDGVVLPHGIAAGHALDLIVTGRQRIGVTGANGSGKSTLLALLNGRVNPVRGRCNLHVRAACLGQHLDTLDPGASPLDHLQKVNPTAAQGELRTRLALLGLAGDAALLPSSQLSGGERMKTALAGVLYAAAPPELLLLDEPTNHLDLYAMQAMEDMLRHYTGALVAVSHDETFLAALELDTRLHIGTVGWIVSPWETSIEKADDS